MMKYISQYSDRLNQATRRIDELEKENKKLRAEIVTLRAFKSRQSIEHSAVKTDIKSHFSQPTVSSSRKTKAKEEEPGSGEEKLYRAICYNNEVDRRGFSHTTQSTHVYKDGIPILVNDPLRPKFMMSTNASGNRNMQLFAERLELKKRVEQQATWRLGDRMRQAPLGESEWDAWCRMMDESPEKPWPPLPPSPTSFLTPSNEEIESKIEVEIEKEDSLAEKTRLHEKLEFSVPIFTDSKKSLDYLRRAAEIVQKSIFDAHKNGLSGRFEFEDGPHLVRLGRNELYSWLGAECHDVYPRPIYYELAYNGHRGDKVYDAILKVVELRNTISHPDGEDLRNAACVDWLLSRAQNICVVLGDEKGALGIRDIRDALRADADNVRRYVRDLHFLSVQPYPVTFDLELHHVKMFEQIISDNECIESGMEENAEFLAVARAWHTQTHRKETS
ncbi:hypothetical protein F5Y01DRAFT_292565 [Xylaria sp. FL0043]|nr:hypothetical protein F5Y01DRAFT_292565 [Xylaria sp. FL0043]